MTTSDSLYFISDNGIPLSQCVTSILEIPGLILELKPGATMIIMEYGPDMFIGGYGTVTFYDYENDEDVTWSIESLKLVL